MRRGFPRSRPAGPALARRPALVLLCFLIVPALAPGAPARADDGWIGYGGSPRLLRGHPSVRMVSEAVRMEVGEREVRVDCRFLFRNDGPARSVRMGFPDEADRYDEQDRSGYLRSFPSYVEGRPVRTELLHAPTKALFWHAKTVRFPAHASVRVRDVYRIRVGVQDQTSYRGRTDFVYRQASYTLHTGASWRGRIDRAEIDVVFQRKRPRPPMRLVRAEHGEADRRLEHPSSFTPSTVFYAGPCRPVAHGNTFRFVRTHWKPRLRDDLWLFFDSSPASSAPR